VSISPLDEICEEKIKYNANGSIKGIDKAGNELIDKLNLNNDVLNNLRMDAIEPFVNPLPEVDQIPEIIAYMESMHSGQYHPFCVAISQVLNNMI
jgi:molybdenum cofactor biosynthesis enzyme MoaA